MTENWLFYLILIFKCIIIWSHLLIIVIIIRLMHLYTLKTGLSENRNDLNKVNVQTHIIIIKLNKCVKSLKTGILWKPDYWSSPDRVRFSEFLLYYATRVSIDLHCKRPEIMLFICTISIINFEILKQNRFNRSTFLVNL
jgi:hypothetical protein